MTHAVAQTPDQITLGIDISKDRLDAHLHPLAVVKQFDNDRTGIAKLIAWITPLTPTRIIFEATGAYHRALDMALGKAALPAVKINPLQLRRFAQATGKRAKTDPIDAIMLARFGYTMQPDIPLARDETIDGLTELLAARSALVKDRTAALNRSKTLTLALLQRQSHQRLKQIETQIVAIDHERATIVKAHQRLRARCEILVSIPGFGDATACTLLIDMPELGSMDAKQSASLAGLAPVTRQSGNWQGKSFIQGGRTTLRQALYRPALVAIRFNPPLKAKYLALRAAGKPAKVAIIAIMHKLLIIANALLRDNRMWTLELARA